MSDIDALRHTIEAFAHLDIAEKTAESEEVEEEIRSLHNFAVDKRCEIVDGIGKNLADDIESADGNIKEK